MLKPTYLDYRQWQTKGDDCLGEIKTRQECASINKARNMMIDGIIEALEEANGLDAFVSVEPLRAVVKSCDGYAEGWTIRFKQAEDKRTAAIMAKGGAKA